MKKNHADMIVIDGVEIFCWDEEYQKKLDEILKPWE